ncbi:uncharacterized protein LOC141650879 [Silene latifolia]|uniref:uncharacterized protein LOC141650879 n=1 Tax=Silene latifolia TaxID=37657 RepID=UPI003D76A9A2
MDNIGSWNVRGMNKLTKQLEIKRFLYNNNVGLFGLVEHKIKDLDCSKVLNNLGQHWNGVSNIQCHPGGRIILIWIEQCFTVNIIAMSDQLISANVKEVSSGNEFMFTVVYGSNDEEERLTLWNDLKHIKDSWGGPWCICGDFNNLLDFNERLGRPVHWSDITEFRECVDYCEVVDIKAQGAFFTWNNKQESGSRVYSRLDRFMINGDWLQLYPEAYTYFLPEGLFDDNPCLCYGRVVVNKLRNLKQPLKELNRNRFSDIEKVVGVAKFTLYNIQCQLQGDPTNTSLMNAEASAADTYRGLAKAHFSFLSQKSKVDWSDPNDIEQAFLSYYVDLLGTKAPTIPVHSATVKLGPVITDDLKLLLLKPITKDEIKATMFSIPAAKSPGPDGFTSHFYKDSWDIIGNDVVGAIKDFLTSGKMSQGGFIRGRNIVENVLICQDLIRLYNRKTASPRCIIKIDLRKADDTVE